MISRLIASIAALTSVDCVQPSLHRDRLSSPGRHARCATACRSPSIAAAEGTPLYVYSAATIAERYRAIDEAFASLSARDALRAEGQLDAGHRPPAARPRQRRRRELRRRDRRRAARRLHPAADRLHRRRQDRSPSWRRRSTSASGRSTPSRPASWSASTRIARERGRRARGSRCASIPTSTRRSHPHISTGLKTNKFGIAIGDVREHLPATSARRRARDRRPAHPRRLADHRPRAAAPRGRGARRALPRELRDDGIAHRAPRSRRRARRSRTTGRRCRPRRTTPPRCCRRSATRVSPSSSSRAAAIVGPARRAAVASRRRQGAAQAGASCS